MKFARITATLVGAFVLVFAAGMVLALLSGCQPLVDDPGHDMTPNPPANVTLEPQPSPS